MALSNWDTMAWNAKGESTIGTFVCPDGVILEIYKNWLYIHDKKAWWQGMPFCKPVVMQISKGEIQYVGLSIYAERGPQESIFVYTKYHDYQSKIDDSFFGIGCYGYVEDKWVGVLPSTVIQFKQWLQDLQRNEGIALPELKDGLRYNQGDAYFADVLGVAIPASKAGETEPTILSHILKED